MAARVRWRGTTAQRGYSGQHPKLRAQWAPVVAAGQATCHAIICLMPSRAIAPGASWHLGHTADRTGWTGPEHAKCNTADGARRGNRMRGQRRATAKAASTPARVTPGPLRTSRDW